MKNQCPHCQNRIETTTEYCPICGLSLKPRTSVHIANENEYAPLGVRLLARAIDYTIIGILICLVDWSAQGALIEGWEWYRLGIVFLPQVTFSLWIGGILFLGYFVVFQSFSGQTPGKWLCQITVLKRGTQIPGVVSNVFRELGVWVTILTGGWLLLILIFSSQNKGFHDFLSGVEVYQTPKNS